VFTRRSLMLSAALPVFAPVASGTRAQDNDIIGPMREMLALLPPLDFAGEQTGIIFSWADQRALLDALEIQNPVPGDYVQNDVLFEATRTITFESALVSFMLSELPDLVGFSVLDVDQFLVAFDSPDRCRVYRGRFDVGKITTALTSHDYATTTEGDWTLLSSPGGDRLDFESPIDSLAPVEFHYVLARENMIVTSGLRSTVDAVLGVPETGRNLLGDLQDVGVLSEIEYSTSAMLMSGELLSYESLGIEPLEATDELPPANWFAAGVWYGEGAPTAQYLVEFPRNEATDAVAVIDERIETGESLLTGDPYSSFLGEVEVDVLPGTGIVTVSGEAQEFTRNWMRTIAVRDLLFLATR
jgi:hypothetical protein